MPDPMEAEIRESIVNLSFSHTLNWQIHAAELTERLTTPPFSEERLQLIQDFVTGNLSDEPLFTVNERYYFSDFNNWLRLMQVLYEHQRLTNDLLNQCLRHQQQHIMLWHIKSLGILSSPIASALQNRLLAFLDDVMWDRIRQTDLTSAVWFNYIDGPQHSRFLALAADYIIKFQITALGKKTPDNSIEGFMKWMARSTLSDLKTDDQRQAFIEHLRQIGKQDALLDDAALDRLHILLPWATHARALLCEVFGWEAAIPVIAMLEGDSEAPADSEDGDQNTLSDVADVAWMRQAMAQAGDALATRIITLFSDADALSDSAFLAAALWGLNRATVEQKLKRHAYIAIKAYGLLPLQENETILQRYLALRRVDKEGQKYGNNRRVNHAEAVQVSMAHLAQITGYADVSRLEWAMEALIAEEVATPDRTWTVDEYELRLQLDGTDVAIHIQKNDRPLKSVPKAVRASSAYQEAKEAASQLRSQTSRLRSGLLESLISTGDALEHDDFTNLMRLPVARDLCRRLIWRTDTGGLGLLDVDTMTLVDMEGNTYPLGERLWLVHSYDLFAVNTLAAWQRHIINKRIVQPIKQAYTSSHPPSKQPIHIPTALQGTQWMARLPAGCLVAVAGVFSAAVVLSPTKYLARFALCLSLQTRDTTTWDALSRPRLTASTFNRSIVKGD